jgi:prophage tail gpP-like protein
MGDFSLVIAGQRYEGWQSVSVARSLEQLAPKFSLGFTERWAGQDEPVPILEGMAAVLEWAKGGLIAGYVDDSDISYDAESHTMQVGGRAKTGDLVDCAAICKGGELRNRTLLEIAQDLCAPFDIGATAETDLGARFARFGLQDGETVFEALDRACRMRGVLMTTDGEGDLVLTRAGQGQTKTVIERGVNVVRGARRGSWKDRHSQYIVKGQSAGTDNLNGSSAAALKRVSVDEDIERYRPTIVMAEGQEASGVELQKRADWERNVRYGKSLRYSYTVRGWECAEGLWAPNTRARVRDPFFRLDAELLIVSATQLRNDEGTQTQLELTRREAFDVLKLPPKRQKQQKDWGL